MNKKILILCILAAVLMIMLPISSALMKSFSSSDCQLSFLASQGCDECPVVPYLAGAVDCILRLRVQRGGDAKSGGWKMLAIRWRGSLS